MPIKFPCRNCKQKLRMSSRAAGRAFECPQCGHKQRAPSPRAPGTAPSSADLAGVQPAKSKDLTENAAPRPGRPTLSRPAADPATKPAPQPSGGLPFDDDEWDQALNPYEPPKENDKPKLPGYGSSGPSLQPGAMRWTKRGLLMVWISIWGGLIFMTMARAAGFVADPEAEGPGVLAMIAGFGLLGTGLLSVVGQLLCVTTPAKTGARGLAITSAASLICCGGIWGLLETADEPKPSDVFALALMAFVAGAAAYVSFLLFLKKLGQFYKHTEVVEGVDKLFIYGISMIVAMLLIPVCLGVAAAFPDFAWVLFAVPVIGIGVWIGSWVLFFIYAGTVRKLLASIRG